MPLNRGIKGQFKHDEQIEHGGYRMAEIDGVVVLKFSDLIAETNRY